MKIWIDMLQLTKASLSLSFIKPADGTKPQGVANTSEEREKKKIQKNLEFNSKKVKF